MLEVKKMGNVFYVVDSSTLLNPTYDLNSSLTRLASKP